jgi:hypothetical protein
MNILKTVTTAAFSIALAGTVLSPLVRAGDSEPVDPRIAKNVTITGCLHAGAHAGQFVLLGVTEKALDGTVVPVPYSIYRLDSTRDMKPLVGELVDISGVVVSRDKKQGKITIDVGGDEGSTTNVTVAEGSRSIKTKSFAGTPATDSVLELNRPVYRVNVDSITPVGGADIRPVCK